MTDGQFEELMRRKEEGAKVTIERLKDKLARNLFPDGPGDRVDDPQVGDDVGALSDWRGINEIHRLKERT